MSVFKRYKGKRVKRGDKNYDKGTWVAHGRVDGVRYNKALPKETVKTAEQANAEDDKIRHQMRSGDFDVVKDRTGFTEYVEKEYSLWLANNSNHKAKRFELVKMKEFFKDQPLKSITPSRCEEFKAWRRDQPRQCQKCIHGTEHQCSAGKVKPQTINKELTTLKQIFDLAERDRKVFRNPMAHVPKFKVEDVFEGRSLTDEERPRLWAAIQDNFQLYAIVLTGILTGFRKTQILMLTKDDLLIKEGKPYLVRHKLKRQPRAEVPVNALVFEVLSQLAEMRDHWLFINPSGNRLGSFDPAWREALRKAGIKGFRFHDTRHTFASMMPSPLVAQAALGHKRSATTMRYTHVQSDLIETAVDALKTDDIPRPDSILTPSERVM